MKENWLFPCNPKYFDIAEHFRNNDIVCFKRRGTTNVGDVAYIYISGTLKQIKYKCEIVEADVKEPMLSKHKYVIKDDPSVSTTPHYTAMKLIKEYKDGEFSLEWLRNHGTSQFIIPMRLSRETVSAIKKIDK